MTEEEFRSIPHTAAAIRVKVEAIRSLRGMALSLSSPQLGQRVKSSGDSDRVGKLVADILDAEAEVAASIQRLASLRLEAITLISSLPYPESSVLSLRYISGMTWEKLAEVVGYEERYVYILARKGIDRIFKS